MKLLSFLLVFIATVSFTINPELTEEEAKLYRILNQYRKTKGLKAIPLSPSLTKVAQLHAKDLADNQPDLGDCNAHSWSNKGEWSACCYTPDHAEAKCMWDKPRELTDYPGNGYEISCGSNDCCPDFNMTADYALKSWQGSPGHHAVMINKGQWAKHEWNAVGVGIYKGFAVIWFGKEVDPAQ